VRVLFVAHDPGGANMLAPLFPLVRAARHGVGLLAAGPAAALWREEASDFDPAAVEPDVVVTGTSMSATLERDWWQRAKTRGIPSLAAIDAPMNLAARFAGAVLPTRIAVPDDGCRAPVGLPDDCFVTVGQPHLQRQRNRLQRRRAARREDRPPLIVFFSEPHDSDRTPFAQPFDQFMAADVLRDALEKCPARLVVQPHPREDGRRWQAWAAQAGTPAAIGGATEDLLIAADLVIGITTMVLVEAAFGGIPAGRIAPSGHRGINPLLDRIELPTAPDVQGAVCLIERKLESRAPPMLPPEIAAWAERADERMWAEIQALLTAEVA
jgi:hypothetical protein